VLFHKPGYGLRPPTSNNMFSAEHSPQLHIHNNRFRGPRNPLRDTYSYVHRMIYNTLLTHNNMFQTLPILLPNTHDSRVRTPCNPHPDAHNYILQMPCNTRPRTHTNPRREPPIHFPVTCSKTWELRMDSILVETMAPLFNIILRRLLHHQSQSL
jgi:hypothetical protein